MLKPLPQHRNSPSSSPIFHYAPNSHSVPTSPLSRRQSASKASFTKPIPTPPPRLQYVHVGTQWSPRLISRMEIRNDSPKVKTEPDQAARVAIAPVVASPIPRPPEEPEIKAESPGIKRRQSQDPPAPTNVVSQTIPPKRSRSDQAVKILPAKYELCPIEDMVFLIADMIQELIQTNDGLPLRSGVLTRFHSRTPPGISVHDYLQRLAKHATLTPPLLLSMVYYIDRLCLLYPAFTINTLTVHRFLITAATVAAKGLSDSFWNNTTYARVGGIRVAELGLLELDFLYRVDWKIVPNPEALVDYYEGLVARIAGYEIEETSSIDEDDGDDDLADDSGIKTEAKSESTLDSNPNDQWQAWMDDVSSKTKQEVKDEDSSAWMNDISSKTKREVKDEDDSA